MIDTAALNTYLAELSDEEALHALDVLKKRSERTFSEERVRSEWREALSRSASGKDAHLIDVLNSMEPEIVDAMFRCISSSPFRSPEKDSEDLWRFPVSLSRAVSGQAQGFFKGRFYVELTNDHDDVVEISSFFRIDDAHDFAQSLIGASPKAVMDRVNGSTLFASINEGEGWRAPGLPISAAQIVVEAYNDNDSLWISVPEADTTTNEKETP